MVRLLLLAIFVVYISAKKPGRPLPTTAKSSRPSVPASSSKSPRRPPPSSSSRKPVSRQPVEDVEDDLSEEEEEDDVIYEEKEEEEILPKRRSAKPTGNGQPPPKAATSAKRRNPPPPARRPAPTRRPPVDRRRRAPYDDVEEDLYENEYDEPYPPPRPGAGGGRPKQSTSGGPQRRGPPPRGGRMVPYTQVRKPTFATTFTKSLAAVGKALPDMKEKAVSGLQTARTATGSLTSNLYREIKGLTSSELEQVLLKATRPDDQSSKGKHVERLIGLTYQMSVSYEVYEALLRKIWSKMAEPDWRTNLKAVYILHRFSADGSPAHAASLKARLREMRRMNDPKRKNTKYFSSKVLLAGKKGNDPSTEMFRAFVGRYAHYVLLRTQCFSGMFDEIARKPGKKDNNLRKEHLDAADMLLKAALLCQLKTGEECENTAIAMERVCADMMAMSSAVATALNRAIGKKKSSSSASPKLIRDWCRFYKDDLLPKTKALIKKTTGKLDAYGLFLPSRMGASIAPDVLEQGLNMEDTPEATIEEAATVEADEKEGVEKEPVKAAPAEKRRVALPNHLLSQKVTTTKRQTRRKKKKRTKQRKTKKASRNAQRQSTK
jgi:ANTH domain